MTKMRIASQSILAKRTGTSAMGIIIGCWTGSVKLPLTLCRARGRAARRAASAGTGDGTSHVGVSLNVA